MMKALVVAAVIAILAASQAAAQSADRRKVWGPGETVLPIHLNAEFDMLVKAVDDLATAVTTATMTATTAVIDTFKQKLLNYADISSIPTPDAGYVVMAWTYNGAGKKNLFAKFSDGTTAEIYLEP
jgi:hypothetical protein